MTKTARRWLIGGAIGVVLLCAAAFLTVFVFVRDERFRLDDYGPSESISIDDKEYTEMIEAKRSFVVFIDKPGCIKTADMSTWFLDFPEEMQFKYYNLSWSYAKKTSIYNYVKYTPSIALINKGEVVAWLDADSEEDKEYYDDPEALKTWLKKYIIF